MPTKLTIKAKDFIWSCTSGAGQFGAPAFLQPRATPVHAPVRPGAAAGSGSGSEGRLQTVVLPFPPRAVEKQRAKREKGESQNQAAPNSQAPGFK